MSVRQRGSGRGVRQLFRPVDDFYAKREQADRVKQKGQDLLKTANNAAARLRRKITMQEKELLDSKDRDKWRIYGELITANLYRMERGMSASRRRTTMIRRAKT